MNYTDTLIFEYLDEESKEYDSDGNQLSIKQAEFFKDSKVRKDNKLLVCYHYTNEDFDVFDKSKIAKGLSRNFNMYCSGFYFTDNGNSLYNTEYKKVVYLNITKPYYLGANDNMSQISSFITAAGYDISKYNSNMPSTLEAIMVCCGYSYSNDIKRFFKKQLLKQKFDGIIITGKNFNDYMVFESNQVKSIDNKYPTKDDSINK